MTNHPALGTEDSKARIRFTAQSKGKRMEISFAPNDALLFWDGSPVAVGTGECTYYLDEKYPSAVTKAIHDFAQDSALIRSSAADFDFVFGSLLTKVGLPLTRRS